MTRGDDIERWGQDWKRWVQDMEFRYKYLVEIILKQRKKIAELEEKLARSTSYKVRQP